MRHWGWGWGGGGNEFKRKVNKNLVKWQLDFYSFITSLFLRQNSCFFRHINAIQEHTDVFVLNSGRLLDQSSCEKKGMSVS